MPKQAAALTPDQMRLGIAQIERRIAELAALKADQLESEDDPKITTMQVAVDDTLESVFGRTTTDYDRYADAARLKQFIEYPTNLDPFRTYHPSMSLPAIRQGVAKGVAHAVALLQQAIKSLKERLEDLGETKSGRALRAYEGLDLHPEIARASEALYRGGHYANAIEDAVKALNDLVRLRSGHTADGTNLMETVFSPGKPILKFNDGVDDSDRNEQKGFMMMFSGAVAGLRNPRAHKLIKDDPERALEFIAFVSLLAKLLDGAKK
jgi:uncharacterized protein (TIGR02391 family)